MFTCSRNKYGLRIKPLKFNINLEIKMVFFPIEPKWIALHIFGLMKFSNINIKLAENHWPEKMNYNWRLPSVWTLWSTITLLWWNDYIWIDILLAESMSEIRPKIDHQSKKVVIKTIETRDGHVSGMKRVFIKDIKFLYENDLTFRSSQIINESTQNEDDEWTACVPVTSRGTIELKIHAGVEEEENEVSFVVSVKSKKEKQL